MNEWFNAWARKYLKDAYGLHVEEIDKIESPWTVLQDLDPDGWRQLADIAAREKYICSKSH